MNSKLEVLQSVYLSFFSVSIQKIINIFLSDHQSMKFRFPFALSYTWRYGSVLGGSLPFDMSMWKAKAGNYAANTRWVQNRAGINAKRNDND